MALKVKIVGLPTCLGRDRLSKKKPPFRVALSFQFYMG
jgi:hypothetical protein